jgi:diguanylate cyclase (GGDEF)-like protein
METPPRPVRHRGAPEVPNLGRSLVNLGRFPVQLRGISRFSARLAKLTGVTRSGKPPPETHLTVRDAARTLPDMQAIRPGSSRPPAEERKAVLVVLAGPQLGERTLVDRSVTIGRGPENQLVLRDPAVSWKHAQVEVVRTADGQNKGIRVRDLGSKHGTEVNGAPIGKEAFLQRGDQLGVGDTLLRLEMHDPVEQAFDHAVIERIARDDLTGLLSRRRFETDLAALVEAANLAGDTLAVVMLDIDGIKGINDAHGHLAGAQTIKEIGRLLGRVVGKRGLTARLGGDELAIALPKVARAEAVQLVEQVLREVRALAIPFGETKLRATISAGIAMLPGDARDEPGLLKAADERLLAAKQGGRDRIG